MARAGARDATSRTPGFFFFYVEYINAVSTDYCTVHQYTVELDKYHGFLPYPQVQCPNGYGVTGQCYTLFVNWDIRIDTPGE